LRSGALIWYHRRPISFLVPPKQKTRLRPWLFLFVHYVLYVNPLNISHVKPNVIQSCKPQSRLFGVSLSNAAHANQSPQSNTAARAVAVREVSLSQWASRVHHLLKAKLHYSWIGAGSELVRNWFETGRRQASNQLRTSYSVMEFGFNCHRAGPAATVRYRTWVN